MKPIISLSPHVHGGDSVQKNMYGVCIALLPALLASLWFFGLGAAIVLVTSVISCVFFEWSITKFLLKRERTTITDGSAILTGLLLGFNLPSNLPIWIIIIGALAAIGIGKMTFGGLGCNPFNPALVGRVFLLISFPAQMTIWPVVNQRVAYVDAETAATPLSVMQRAIAEGDPGILSELPSLKEMLIGATGGSLGEVSAICLLLGCLFLLWKKIITWHIPVSILGTVALLACVMNVCSPVYANPLQVLMRMRVSQVLAYCSFLINVAPPMPLSSASCTASAQSASERSRVFATRYSVRSCSMAQDKNASFCMLSSLLSPC